MPVEIDIVHVARLARLDLDTEALETYRAQLGVILEHAARVQTLEGEAHVETTHPLGLVNVFREDVAMPALDRDEVLEQAPLSEQGFFVVPPALETE